MSLLNIPVPIIAVVSKVLAIHHTHDELDAIFQENGIPGDIPVVNKIKKCETWLKRCNSAQDIDALKVLGKILEHFMEVDKDNYEEQIAQQIQNRQKVYDALSKYGLNYHPGGQLSRILAGLSTKTLNEILKNKDLIGVEQEFQRALNTIESDPPAGLTAACSILESLCKIYIEDEGLSLPSNQTIKPLWKVVSKHLGFRPELVDDDLKNILSGLFTTVEGLGSLRTHAGSAHGRGRKTYNIKARHARLATHAAHTLCVFIIETWIDKNV